MGTETHELVRFTTHIKNIGDLDYYIGVPNDEGTNVWSGVMLQSLAPTAMPSTTCSTHGRLIDSHWIQECISGDGL